MSAGDLDAALEAQRAITACRAAVGALADVVRVSDLGAPAARQAAEEGILHVRALLEADPDVFAPTADETVEVAAQIIAAMMAGAIGISDAPESAWAERVTTISRIFADGVVAKGTREQAALAAEIMERAASVAFMALTHNRERFE